MDIKMETINKLISIEWEMFTAVNDGEETASCQEDRLTFNGMRKAQFDAWPFEVIESYLDDLTKARSSDRNLIEEKYIHMMRTTEPSKYKALLIRVNLPTEYAGRLAKEISDALLEQTRVLFEDYPYVSGCGRPLYSALDYGTVSIETYQLSELLTYSEKTLLALREHLRLLEEKGISLARTILENTVRFYGYDSLDRAEAVSKEKADEIGFEVSFGCICEERDDEQLL